MSDTAALQHWMQAAILAGSGDGDVRDRIRGDNRLAAETRLGIYAVAYRLRLIECLQTEYPVLHALAGPTVFELFARGYIAAHPSRSYTLYDFGAGFANYLAASRPPGDATAPEAVPAALARVERAKAEVARARGLERDTGSAGGAFDPFVATLLGLDGPRAYRLPDSVRLLALSFDVMPTLLAAERGGPLPFPPAAASFVAVSRVDYRVACHGLEDWQYRALSHLPDPDVEPATAARLTAWWPTALRLGLVAPR